MTTEATIGDCVKKWAKIDPDTPAFIFVDPTWRRKVLSRGDVYRLATKYAAILKRSGVQKGDIVANTLPNTAERVITHVGVILAGAVSMNGQVLLRDGEDFVGILKDSGCVAVIIDPSDPKGAACLLEAREKVVLQDGNVLYPELPALKNVFEVYTNTEDKNKSLFELLDKEVEEVFVQSRPDDHVVVWTTSGSTGYSKLIPLSHRKILLFFEQFSIGVNLETDDVLYNGAPLGWACGELTTYLTRGITRVIPDFSRQAAKDRFAFIWDLICEEKCAGAFLSPTDMEGLVINYSKRHQANSTEHVSSDDVDSESSLQEEWKLKGIFSGGQPLKETQLAVLGTLTSNVRVLYGATEVGMMTMLSITDAESYENCNNGQPVEGVQLKIVNDKMEEVPCGQIGEIMCKSEQTFDGYLNNDASTLKTIMEDGWIKTGDIGTFNEKGQVFVFCRKAFSIIRGCYLVYPGWLESRLLKYPGVVNVVLVPVPDPVKHQELCACIVTHPGAQVTAEGFQEFCENLFLKDRDDPMTAVPRYYLFFDALPTNSVGKLCRKTTAALATKRLGLTDK